jgi:hypothetical protein
VSNVIAVRSKRPAAEGDVQMKSNAKRLAAVAAVSAVGVLAPAASASAALPAFTLPTLPTLAAPHYPMTGFKLPAAGLAAFTPPAGLPAFNPPAFTPPGGFVGPVVGQVAAVIGPTVITTAPSTFNNTNIQTSAGGNGLGGQAGAG